MSGFARRLQRKWLRNSGKWEGNPQPFVALGDGGYRTLRPTKGWVRVSGKRLRAQRRMQQLLAGRAA